MGIVPFSRRAEADLLEIGEYTIGQWGEDQAERYLDGLQASCRVLAGNPDLGRPCDEIRPGLRRMESGRHIVFYRRDSAGILVSRILHRRMLPELQAIGDEDYGS